MVLIIDDDKAVCASLIMLLRKEGFTAIAVQTPTDALAFLQQETPEIILLDMNFSNETTGSR